MELKFPLCHFILILLRSGIRTIESEGIIGRKKLTAHCVSHWETKWNNLIYSASAIVTTFSWAALCYFCFVLFLPLKQTFPTFLFSNRRLDRNPLSFLLRNMWRKWCKHLTLILWRCLNMHVANENAGFACTHRITNMYRKSITEWCGGFMTASPLTSVLFFVWTLSSESCEACFCNLYYCGRVCVYVCAWHQAPAKYYRHILHFLLSSIDAEYACALQNDTKI